MELMEKLENINSSIKNLKEELARLEALGKGVPAVEKNITRLRGSLRALEVQFDQLA